MVTTTTTPTWFESMLRLKDIAGELCPNGHPFLIEATTLENGIIMASFICNEDNQVTTVTTQHSPLQDWHFLPSR